jgi:hypothetical protein
VVHAMKHCAGVVTRRSVIFVISLPTTHTTRARAHTHTHTHAHCLSTCTHNTPLPSPAAVSAAAACRCTAASAQRQALDGVDREASASGLTKRLRFTSRYVAHRPIINLRFCPLNCINFCSDSKMCVCFSLVAHCHGCASNNHRRGANNRWQCFI